MKIWNTHPANLRKGDLLCDDDGDPFATVTGTPDVYTSGTVVVPTNVVSVEFPYGTTANIDR
jgi:hypothetical protein